MLFNHRQQNIPTHTLAGDIGHRLGFWSWCRRRRGGRLGICLCHRLRRGKRGRGRLVVWFCGTVGVGCTELGCPTAGVFTCPVGTGLLCGVVTEGVEGAVATMFCVGVGATGLADTALSRSLPPPPPQAASITLSAVAVQVVRRIWGCLAAILRLQGATYCTRWTMEKSYSWPWAVPDVSAKKHQSQQGEGGGLLCGSDDGCRIAVVAGTLSRPD